MRTVSLTLLVGGLFALLAAPAVEALCSPDSVLVGLTCVDKYEASVWSIPAANTRLIAKVKLGVATLANLTAGEATQVSLSGSSSCSPAFPGSFPDTGNWTAPLYAVSIPGVLPTVHHLVPGGAGLRPLGQAPAHQPGVAAGGGRHARPGR